MHFHNKNTQQTKTRREIPQQSIYEKPTIDIILCGERHLSHDQEQDKAVLFYHFYSTNLLDILTKAVS